MHTRILRHPTTWAIAVIGGIYGGLEMYSIRELKREGGAEILFPWLWLERSVDFLFGASVQIVYLLCVIWMVAGLMENTNVWIRQITVVVLYLGLNWLAQFL